MENQFSFKEMYDVIIKTTSNIEIEGKIFEKDETIAAFDKINLIGFDEKRQLTVAHGGYNDKGLVWWEEAQSVDLIFTQGVFSKGQFAVMANAKLFKDKQMKLPINIREQLESDEDGKIYLSHKGCSPLFVYRIDNGEKLVYQIIDQSTLKIDSAYTLVMVDYWYNYENYSVLQFGQNLSNGTFYLSGKTKIKDDITGQVKTGIIQIPKLKLMSNLSIRLGKDSVPVMGRLQAQAIPTGERGSKRLMEIIFLDEEIDNN